MTTAKTTANRKLKQQVKRTARIRASEADTLKTGIKRRARTTSRSLSEWSAKKQTRNSTWETAKKVGAAAAAAALPIVATAIADAIELHRKKAAPHKGQRKSTKTASA